MTAAPTAQRPLGVALVGLGFGEKIHLPALRDCPLTEPVALWHHRPERLDQACRNHDLPGFSDFEALLADPDTFAPGTTMIISSGPVTDPKVRRAVINMLKRDTMPGAVDTVPAPEGQ